MQVSKTIKIWLEYHKSHSRDNTLKAYHVVLSNFNLEFGDSNVAEITSDEVLSFLNRITEGTSSKPSVPDMLIFPLFSISLETISIKIFRIPVTHPC